MVNTPKFKELSALIEGMISHAGSGHYASSMSALQIMYPLFYEEKIRPDCFILSKGHAAPALYAILYDLGYLVDGLDKFREWDGLPGHPEIGTPGVLCSSGSLGMGISKAVGLAAANPEKVYHVLVGDGELQEGQIWEALTYIDFKKIRNVRIHVDLNRQQYSGRTPGAVVSSRSYIIPHGTEWIESNNYLTVPKVTDSAYPVELLKQMGKDERIVVLNADLEHDFGLQLVREIFPDRYFQCGISEQHMVSMANGLALAGKIPICHTFSAFYRRAIDQMYNNACDGLNVGYVAGLTKKSGVNIGMSHAPAPRESLREMTGVNITVNIEEFFHALAEGKGAYFEI